MRELFPTLIIGGAPKCGTSSLFRWLADHPSVCGSSIKETYYLVDRGHTHFNPHANVHDHGAAGFARYFAHHQDEPVLLEATTHTLYQATARKWLADRDTQLVFVLRKPSERVYSAYQYAVNNLATIPRAVSFADFVEVARGGRDPSGRIAVDIVRRVHNELAYSRYAEHVRAWLEALGPARVLLVLFQDLIRDPAVVLAEIARRCAIAPDFYEHYEFRGENATATVRSQGLHRLAQAVAARLPRGSTTRWLRSAYRRLFTEARRPDQTAEDRRVLAELDAEFRDDTVALAEATGLDLATWT